MRDSSQVSIQEASLGDKHWHWLASGWFCSHYLYPYTGWSNEISLRQIVEQAVRGERE
jgi:hypothetical protein